MYYASFGALSIILHLIINSRLIRVKWDKESSESIYRYKWFMISVTLYYIVDMLWGTLYDTRIVPLAYADTFLYFFSMVLSVLLWTRYVVSYIGRKGLFSSFLTFIGWTIFTLQLLTLIVNFFYPIMFRFGADGEYFPSYARYVNLATQIVLFFVTAVYTLIIAVKTEGKVRNHNTAVGVSGLIMTVFIILQALYPLLPFYAIGLIIGTCLIHVFIEEDERMDYRAEIGEIKQKVAKVRSESESAKKKNITFGQIAESMAENYDIIYYIDTDDDSYVGYTSNSLYGRLDANRNGDDFFDVAVDYVNKYVHPDDRERLLTIVDKDYLLTAMRSRKKFYADCRVVVDGDPEYTKFSARRTSDSNHLIITVENIDDEVKKEKAQKKALSNEKELARRDELTGTKNKTAFIELEQSVQENLDKGLDYLPFALAVCDINDLKTINDTMGHQAGDDYIKEASKLLCDIFVHSPVFRVGGDEFVVFLGGADHDAKEELLGRLRSKVFENSIRKNGPVVAVGVSAFDPAHDNSFSDVFERADALMYENKKELKTQFA